MAKPDIPAGSEDADAFQKAMFEASASITQAYSSKIDLRAVALLQVVEWQLQLIQSLHARVRRLEDYNYHGQS